MAVQADFTHSGNSATIRLTFNNPVSKHEVQISDSPMKILVQSGGQVYNKTTDVHLKSHHVTCPGNDVVINMDKESSGSWADYANILTADRARR